MKNNFQTRLWIRSSAAVLLLCACLPFAGHGEDAGALADRLDSLIEAMNTTAGGRVHAIEAVYNELRGPNSREMQTMLRESLSRANTLIVQGAVETLAMLGDPTDIGAIGSLLATTGTLEVKNVAIRLLPAFCLMNSERSRFNYIAYAVGYQRVAAPDILEPLRRPPLTRRGRLNHATEQMQTRVTRILAGQFDPVGTALPYSEDLFYGPAARAAIEHYIGKALGNDPSRWARIWAAQGMDMEYLVPDEIAEIRSNALLSLSDMGAEGLPELIAAFSRLLDSDDEALNQSAFETMGVMCRTGFDDFGPLAAMDFSQEDATEAENWRRRRFMSTKRIARFSILRATNQLPQARDSGLFAAAAGCVGSALNYPPDFPDEDGLLLESRKNGIAELERMLLMPDIDRGQRAAVAVALGQAGSVGSVAAILSIVQSPYASPEFGSDGLRMAEAAVDALLLAATGIQDGRDDARTALLAMLADARSYAPVRADAPPVGLAHLVLWRLQRLARSTDTSLNAENWKSRLGW